MSGALFTLAFVLAGTVVGMWFGDVCRRISAVRQEVERLARLIQANRTDHKHVGYAVCGRNKGEVLEHALGEDEQLMVYRTYRAALAAKDDDLGEFTRGVYIRRERDRAPQYIDHEGEGPA